ITLASIVDQLKSQGAAITELLQRPVNAGSPASTFNASPDNTTNAMPANTANTILREESVEASNLNESRLAGKKVKLPVFEFEDPVAWITRAEIYFDVQQTPDDMRVKLSRLSMEGPTIHWFNLLMETEDLLSWEKLKKSLIARYGGRRLENPFEELSTLRQNGSVEEYMEAFELLSEEGVWRTRLRSCLLFVKTGALKNTWKLLSCCRPKWVDYLKNNTLGIL
ncbi:retrotransposon gag protein, partial [Trifolium medium]|nr:retrotransposon gag protein [Trifolium medium]